MDLRRTGARAQPLRQDVRLRSRQLSGREVKQAGETTITVTPEYDKCSSSLGPVTVRINGCSYLFHLTAEIVSEAHTYTATTDLKCPAGKQVEIDLFTSHSNHTEGKVACRYTLGEEGNQGLGTIDLTNKAPTAETPKNWLTAHVDTGNITSTRTIGSALICGPEHDSAGTLTGDTFLKGTNELGEDNGITISTEI